MTALFLIGVGVLLALGAAARLSRRGIALPSGQTAGGALLLIVALGLVAARQVALALPLGILSLAMLGGRVGRARTAPDPGGRSRVETAALAMELDHDSGEMDGVVLAGRFEDRRLSALGRAEIDALAAEFAGDADTLALLRAYCERRFGPDAADSEPEDPAGGADPGGMSVAEAYRILGLDPDADAEAIRAAHRRLMRKLHPDQGGSDALAALINQAKARLDR
jgi:hypothetical protein